jgi:2'-5' RNA ligase
MRTFFCIPLERQLAKAIDRLATQLRDRVAARASWVRPENYHVTLRFLGDIEPDLTIDLEQAARRVTERLAPFALPLDRLGAFPSIDRARVLWVGGGAPAEFLGLTLSLQHELGRLGFPREQRPTVAHITLARLKGRPDADLPRTLGAAELPPNLSSYADRIVLMQSELTPTGAIYTPLFTTPFGG